MTKLDLAILLIGFAFFLLAIGVVKLGRDARVKENDQWRDRLPLFFRLLRPLVNLFLSKAELSANRFQTEVIQDKLNNAGMGYVFRPVEFLITRRIGLGLGIVLFSYIYLMLGFTNNAMIVMGAIVLPLSYFYPDIWLRDAIKKRQILVAKQFPFFLDLLLLSIRAGLNFSSSISHSVAKIPPGPIREEFARMLRDVRTGVSRREALNRLGKRLNVSAVANFVSSVNQAEDSGGELGDVLLQQAKQRRTERFLYAEKQANKAPVKLLLPLVGLLFPIIFIIIGFPLYWKMQNGGGGDFFGG